MHVFRTLLSFSLLLIFTLATSFAWAWPPTYGAEFEVSNDEIRSSVETFVPENADKSVEKAAQMRFVEDIRARCPVMGCQVIEVEGKFDKDYRVQYADGWWFQVSYDPKCVEITFKPSTREQLIEKSQLINTDIFQAARNLGLTTPPEKMNHFNMGVRSAFGDSAREFLKFFVDYSNHAHLALGGLGKDLNNSPTLSVLGEGQRLALQEIVQEFNQGKHQTIAQVARAIEDRVYTKSYNEKWGGSIHYQALGLKYINRTDLTQADAPFEIRALWGQENAETFNKIAELVEGRIQFLRQSKTPIIYNQTDKKAFSNIDLKTRFFIYVEESGLKFEDFKELLRTVVANAPLSPFMNEQFPIEKRLKSIEGYWDLLLVSPLVRKTMLEMISKPEAANHFITKALLKRLYKDLNSMPTNEALVQAAQNPVEAPVTMKPTAKKATWLQRLVEKKVMPYFRIPAPRAKPPVEKEIHPSELLKEFITDFEAQAKISHSCSKVFAF